MADNVRRPGCGRRGSLAGTVVHDPDAGLAAYGWDERLATLAEPHLAAGHQVGRVVTVERRHDTVATPAGHVRLDRAHPAFRSAALASPPAVGDWAVVATDDHGPAIIALLERHGVLARRDPAVRDVEQVVAANIDVVAATFPLDRPLRAAKLERVLVMAHEGGVEPQVVLTKADLAKHEETALATLAEVAADVPVLRTSTVTATGLDQFRALVAPGRTVALVGESGAGKSSLVNSLVGREVQPVADVRARDRKGRHTTVARRLVAVPGGGVVVDTPGLRALGLWSDEGLSLDDAFPEVTVLAADCRFRDCTHRAEPGCAVRAAVADGRLDLARLDRYQALAEEYDSLDRRRQESSWRSGRTRRRRR